MLRIPTEWTTKKHTVSRKWTAIWMINSPCSIWVGLELEQEKKRWREIVTRRYQRTHRRGNCSEPRWELRRTDPWPARPPRSWRARPYRRWQAAAASGSGSARPTGRQSVAAGWAHRPPPWCWRCQSTHSLVAQILTEKWPSSHKRSPENPLELRLHGDKETSRRQQEMVVRGRRWRGEGMWREEPVEENWVVNSGSATWLYIVTRGRKDSGTIW
jgi:hypothetical protein